jgi:uncharacterized coiled-coil protein SlyX
MSQPSSTEQLEVKIAHLDQAIHELSEALYQQQLRMDAQDRLIRQLIERLESGDRGSAGANAQFEIPPHY